MDVRTGGPRHGKKWGEELWIENNPLYCMKILSMQPGFACSLHHHPVKDEVFFVDSGKVEFELEGEVRTLHSGQSIRVRPGQKHRFWVKFGNLPARVVESSTHHDDNDVVRHEESKELYKEIA